MCGFAGIVVWDPTLRVDREALGAMSACIAHRGPDGEGTWWNEGSPQVGLAHRRLAIIDPDPRANQPFGDETRATWLVFNGEIYNFRQLREELKHLRPDYPWRTHCDTEVLLLAYEVWGEKCVDHLNGMYAFAVWDQNRNTLYLARDRMGQKPLYVAVRMEGKEHIRAVAFASELSALRRIKWVDTQLDSRALADYLCWGYVPAPRTIYRGVGKLEPATWMRIGPGGLEQERYFDPNELARPSGDPVQRTRELITEAVGRQLVADVPLGCFLSGGVDSSIIAAAMKATAGKDQPVRTFSIGFDDPRYDETAYAAAVARRLGTDHQQFTVRPHAAEDLPKLAAVFGEPFGDSSALPTHYLSRQTRQFVKVALSGDGGDELFGGYDRYRAMWMGESFAKMPAALRRIAVSKLWQKLPGQHPKSMLTRAKRLLASLDLPPAQRYATYMRLFDPAQVAEILPTDLLPQAEESGQWLVNEYEALSRGRDVVQAAMAVDRVTYLPEDLLTKVDRCSMLHALEVRSPFMDHNLVHFAANLSTTDLLGQPVSRQSFMGTKMGGGKRLLREAFAMDLPREVFHRLKMGFAVPIGQWFRGELRDMLRGLLFATGSFTSTHLQAPAVQRLVDDHEQSRADHSQRLYALLMLELWWQQGKPE